MYKVLNLIFNLLRKFLQKWYATCLKFGTFWAPQVLLGFFTFWFEFTLRICPVHEHVMHSADVDRLRADPSRATTGPEKTLSWAASQQNAKITE